MTGVSNLQTNGACFESNLNSDQERKCHFDSWCLNCVAGIKDPFDSTFKAAHNLLRSHARAYHTYCDQFKAKQQGACSSCGRVTSRSICCSLHGFCVWNNRVSTTTA